MTALVAQRVHRYIPRIGNGDGIGNGDAPRLMFT